MSLKNTVLNHGEILKFLKNDSNILSLIYAIDLDELEDLDSLKWNNELIEKAISSTTNIKINYSDELLMHKLRSFFNVDIAMEV